MLIHNPVGHNLQDTIYETMWMSKFIEIQIYTNGQ